MSLISEFRRRRVFRLGAAYAVGAWLAVQVASIALPAFDAPPSAMRIFILLALLGLPATLALAWLVVLTPSGMRLDPSTKGNKRFFSIAALLVVLALGWYFQGLPAFRGQTAPVATAAVAGERSIAVLPFVNMSSDKEQEYFSDGLAEELLNQLGQLPQLRVVARASSFSFKGRNADVGTIARALNVANLLEGSVRRSGTRLRITAQLVRALDSSQVWSATYDRELADVLRIQDEIATAVVAALKIRLLPEQQVASRHASANPEAYNAYLLGSQLSNRASEEGYRGALAAFRRAIELDPRFAAAYAGVGYAEVYMADYATTPAQTAAAETRALAAADRAIELAPDLADGYAVRGWMRSNFTWDWSGARADLERARALDPANSTIHRRYGQLLGSLGQLPEAIAEIRKAVSLDPLAAAAWSNLGYYLMVSGNQPEARTALERALAINPDSVFAQSNLAFSELFSGHAQAALARFRTVDEGYGLYGVAIAEHTLGDAAASRRTLDALVSRYGLHYVQVAEVHAWRGETDAAFAWLERAYHERDGGLADIKFDPLLVSLRADPRFRAVLVKMGLPD